MFARRSLDPRLARTRALLLSPRFSICIACLTGWLQPLHAPARGSPHRVRFLHRPSAACQPPFQHALALCLFAPVSAYALHVWPVGPSRTMHPRPLFRIARHFLHPPSAAFQTWEGGFRWLAALGSRARSRHLAWPRPIGSPPLVPLSPCRPLVFSSLNWPPARQVLPPPGSLFPAAASAGCQFNVLFGSRVFCGLARALLACGPFFFRLLAVAACVFPSLSSSSSARCSRSPVT